MRTLARHGGADGWHYLHATPDGLVEVTGQAAKLLRELDQKDTARKTLASATLDALADPARRASIAGALQVLGADRALVDEVSQLR